MIPVPCGPYACTLLPYGGYTLGRISEHPLPVLATGIPLGVYGPAWDRDTIGVTMAGTSYWYVPWKCIIPSHP